LLVADEPTTALDATVQAQIIELLSDLVRERSLSVMLITHDLGVVANFATRTYVMYAGRIVEHSATASVFGQPEHPYTAGLIRSITRLDVPRSARLATIPGRPPNPRALPSGCAFHPRCELARDECVRREPALEERGREGHVSACHFPLTGGLVQTVKSYAPARQRAFADVLLEARDITKVFEKRGTWRASHGGAETLAVDNVSLTVRRGESVGLVGESGSGKSTLGRCILRLIEPTEGQILFDGIDVMSLDRERLRRLRREMQMIFQDPFASLDPRYRVGDAIAEPMRIHKLWGQKGYDEKRVFELLETVGLPRDAAHRGPASFSGGERQRIGIARALAVRPKLIICDEPVSALDVSIRAQIINLLLDLQDEYELSYLFIAHDLTVIRHVCDRVAVMSRGKIVEFAHRDQLYESPKHAYTKALLDAVFPIPDPHQESLPDVAPRPARAPHDA